MSEKPKVLRFSAAINDLMVSIPGDISSQIMDMPKIEGTTKWLPVSGKCFTEW